MLPIPEKKPPQTDLNQKLIQQIELLEEKIAQLELDIRLQNEDNLHQFQRQSLSIEEHTEKIKKINDYLVRVDMQLKNISFDIGAVARNLIEVQNYLKNQSEKIFEMANLIRSQASREKEVRENREKNIIGVQELLEKQFSQTNIYIKEIVKKLEIIGLVEQKQNTINLNQATAVDSLLRQIKGQISQEVSQLGRSVSSSTAILGPTSALESDEVVELRSLDKEFDDSIQDIQGTISELVAGGLEVNRLKQLKKREEQDSKITSIISEAQVLIAQNHTQKALQLLEQAQREISDHPGLNLALADLYINMGDLSSAEKQVGTLLESSEPQSDAIKLIGKIRLKQNDLPAAIVHFEKAKALNPQDAELFVLLGKAYHGNQQVLKAIECWEKANAMQPGLLDKEIEIRILLEENRRITGNP